MLTPAEQRRFDAAARQLDTIYHQVRAAAERGSTIDARQVQAALEEPREQMQYVARLHAKPAPQ